jgi:hypothetical protein
MCYIYSLMREGTWARGQQHVLYKGHMFFYLILVVAYNYAKQAQKHHSNNVRHGKCTVHASIRQHLSSELILYQTAVSSNKIMTSYHVTGQNLQFKILCACICKYNVLVFFFEKGLRVQLKEIHYNAHTLEPARKIEKRHDPRTLQKDPPKKRTLQRSPKPNCNQPLLRSPPANTGKEHDGAISPKRALGAASEARRARS